MAFQIKGHGWEMLVKRLGLQHGSRHQVRTYGTYQVYIDGVETDLSGHICECTGPGNNTRMGKTEHLRIREGRYAVSTQYGLRYRSVGYTRDETHPPAFLLLGTGVRTAILVHPGHPPKLYLSSIGCFNPTKPLRAGEKMVFTESRARVVAMLNSLKQHDPAAFARNKIGDNTMIEDAFVVVDGEPMKEVREEEEVEVA